MPLLICCKQLARRISDEFQREHQHIPWSLIIGMRHRVVHDYMAVDKLVVWKTLTDDLPLLIAQLEKIVPPEEDS